MRLAIDARMIDRSGIGTCIREWVSRIDYSILLGKREAVLPYIKNNPEIIPFESSIYGYKEQLAFPYRRLKKLKPDVLHVPHCNIPIFYRGKMIVHIHDLTHLMYPQFLPFKAVAWYFRFIFWSACKKANHIITVSENTKRDIIRFFHTSEKKISVVPSGVGKEFVRKSKPEVEYLYGKYSIPRNKKLLLYVGNMLPHKNLSRLLDAFSKLENKKDCRLVLVGKTYKKRSEDLGIEESEDSDLIISTGMVSKEDLVALYNLADLLILPSLYEGFGLPVLEAFACGTPVACSGTSSLPEVGGTLASYFNPEDPDEMAKVISEALSRENNPEACISWARRFSWEISSRKIWQIAERVAEV